MALAALGLGDLRGERAQLRQRLHAEVAEPLDQPVQHVDGGPGVVAAPGGSAWSRRGRTAASVASRQLGTSSRVSTRRASTAVSTTAKPGHAMRELRAGRLEEADVERRVVRDEHAAAGELEERRAARRRSSARRPPSSR